MGIREKLNQNPSISIAVALALVILMSLWTWSRLRSRVNMVDVPPTRFAWYTADGGNTFFFDIDDKKTPFDYRGKPAFKAYMFKCGNHPRWVQYLEKNSDGKTMVRRPTDSVWIPQDDSRAAEICTPHCPPGQTPVPVPPPSI